MYITVSYLVRCRLALEGREQSGDDARPLLRLHPREPHPEIEKVLTYYETRST